ncbi:MAG TPA: helix-turn-helix domain-containing protein [Polyangiales bacterium]|nr:helix-turn-helix domain-containing protein [Polyangiales bacterium]
MKDLTPKDHAEAVATFRHAVIGPVCARELSRGDLAEALRELAKVRVRPPGSTLTTTYSVPTLERWLYAYRQGGLEALRPRARSDKGRGRHLSDELRRLICDIRREHPNASARLIVRTLEADGRRDAGAIKPSTVRKLLRQEGLDRIAVRDGMGAKTRLRWQAAAPDALWHADVCHGPTLHLAGVRAPIRIHGMLARSACERARRRHVARFDPRDSDPWKKRRALSRQWVDISRRSAADRVLAAGH